MIDDAFIAAILAITCVVGIAGSLVAPVVAWVLDGSDTREEVGR